MNPQHFYLIGIDMCDAQEPATPPLDYRQMYEKMYRDAQQLKAENKTNPVQLDTAQVSGIQSTLSGVKFDSAKPPMDLLDPVAITELAKVLQFGANKYAAHNWRKGIATSRLIAALLRHTFAYLGGEDKDPETGLSHIAHAMCCCMFILGLQHRADCDDRQHIYKGTQDMK
jgi:hypothetical protein